MSNEKNPRVNRGNRTNGQTGSEPQHPGGCPIEGHEGYGCTCNQIGSRR